MWTCQISMKTVNAIRNISDVMKRTAVKRSRILLEKVKQATYSLKVGICPFHFQAITSLVSLTFFVLGNIFSSVSTICKALQVTL